MYEVPYHPIRLTDNYLPILDLEELGYEIGLIITPKARRWVASIHRESERNCPKRGRSNTSTVDLVGMRTPKPTEKYHFGGP